MAELKTKENDGDVRAFVDAIADPGRRDDCVELLTLLAEVTKCEPRMWGENIVGYGHYDYTYASGHSGSWFRIGFSPRKQNLTLYLMCGFEAHADLLQELGPHKLGKSCLYLKRLSAVDRKVLTRLLRKAWKAKIVTC